MMQATSSKRARARNSVPVLEFLDAIAVELQHQSQQFPDRRVVLDDADDRLQCNRPEQIFAFL